MVNKVNRRKSILSAWQLASSAVMVLMLIKSANSETISGFCTGCDYVLKVGDLCEIVCKKYTEIPTDIENPGKVTSLDMGQGNIIDVLKNGSFARSQLTSVRILNLEFCKVRVVEPYAFAGSNALVQIYLGNNLITVLSPDIFANVPNLEVLNLENNPISTVEPGKIFPNLKNLFTLNLSNCRLDTIPTNLFDNLENLHDLDLSGNYFKGLDGRAFRNMKNVTALRLENNPWHCDCYTQFLLETLNRMSCTDTFENITCDSAKISSTKEDLWNETSGENMTCHPENYGVINSHKCDVPRSRTNENGEVVRQHVKESFMLGQDIYFECKYSGILSPDYESRKNMKLMASINNFDEDAKIQPKRMEHDKKDVEVGEIFLVRRIQVKDAGTYTCILILQHGHALRSVYRPKIDRKDEETTNFMRMWILIFVGLGLVMVAVIAAILWIKRRKQEDGKNFQVRIYFVNIYFKRQE